MPQRWIDIHTHIMPDKLYAAIRNWFSVNAGWDLLYKGTWRDAASLLESTEGLCRYLAFGYAHKPGIAGELNRFYAELPSFSPKAISLGCAHQDDDDLRGMAKNAFSMGLRGFKVHCQVQKVAPCDRRLWPLYEETIEEGGLVMFHAGTGPFPGDFVGYDLFEPVLKRFPELKCIVAHLGCHEPEKFLRAALEWDNLYLDTAYTFMDSPKGRMEAPLGLVGEAAHKILFATDFPGISHEYADGVRAINELPLDEAQKDAVFYGNAARLLGV